MGIYNRLMSVNQPSGWQENHNPITTPGKNIDWYHWRIAVHPFTDMLFLHIRGELGSGQTALNRVKSLFDLSETEATQFTELWTNFISVDGTSDTARIAKLMEFQSIMRAIERDIPQQLVAGDFKTWLYGKFGITTADDR